MALLKLHPRNKTLLRRDLSMVKPIETLKNRALRLLARREHSRAELKAKLLPYDENDEVDTLLDHLQEKNWLSDNRFTEEWVRQRSIRYGRQRLQYELKQKGVAAELIESSLDAYSEDELERARQVWQKKYGTPALTLQDKAKQMRFLQYRGYSWDIIRQIVEAEND
jgi:regulatory protein